MRDQTYDIPLELLIIVRDTIDQELLRQCAAREDIDINRVAIKAIEAVARFAKRKELN